MLQGTSSFSIYVGRISGAAAPSDFLSFITEPRFGY